MRILNTILGSRRRVDIQAVPSDCEVTLYLWDGLRITVEQEPYGTGAGVNITVKGRNPIPVYDDHGEELCTIRPREEEDDNG